MCASLRSRSVSQRVQVFVAVADRSDRIGGLIVLDEVVLDSGLVALSEDGAEIDRPLSDVHHLFVRQSGGVLDVNERESLRVLVEEVDRIGSAIYHPKEIHLEVDERRIGLLEQNVVRPGAVDCLELEVVVVVGEAEASRFRLLPGSIPDYKEGDKT